MVSRKFSGREKAQYFCVIYDVLPSGITNGVFGVRSLV